MIYLPAVIAAGFYFDKRRALATGIAVCGSGIGTFVMAPLVSSLVEWYGWRGAMMVQAGQWCGWGGAMMVQAGRMVRLERCHDGAGRSVVRLGRCYW